MCGVCVCGVCVCVCGVCVVCVCVVCVCVWCVCVCVYVYGVCMWCVWCVCVCVCVYVCAIQYDQVHQQGAKLRSNDKRKTELPQAVFKSIILHFVDHVSLYNLVNKANLVQNFSMCVYFFSLHVSRDCVPIIRRNNCTYAVLGGEWESTTNRELEELSKGENIVKWIKGQRISWLGRLERMEEDRMPKKIFTQELEGKGRDEEEDPGKDGEKWKEIFKCWE